MVWKKYGLEMEFTGITRKRAAEQIAEHFGTAAQYSFEGDKYSVTDPRDRVWTVLPCPSVRAERWQNNRMVGANHLYHMKICTPLLYESDFDTVEKILGRLETGGAATNESTGMAVLWSTAGLDDWERFANNMANLYRSRGALLQKSLGREFGRLMDFTMLDGQGVVSMSLFPSSLDENDVKGYVQLAQGIAGLAAKSKRIQHKESDSPNEKFLMRTWLVRLGFVGEEYKYARKLLTENLSGNSAWLRISETEETAAAEIQQDGDGAEIAPSGDVAGDIQEIPESPPSHPPVEETEAEKITQDGITM